MNYIDVINDYQREVKELQLLNDFINNATLSLGLKNVIFNVIIVSDEKIHKINKKYRNIDKPTDVISFALEDNKMIDIPGIRLLGDIYISYDKVKTQAKLYGHTTEREICFLAVHGLLHLLGYDHKTKLEEKKMFDLQKELLNNYGIKKENKR